MGYEGGRVSRALSKENGDVDRASVRLSRDYSGFDGLHCLSKGHCFGDPRQAVFREPERMARPEAPPAFQAPPPAESAYEKRNEKLQLEKQRKAAQQLGVDYSGQILAGQRFQEDVLPRLDPFKRVSQLPVEEEHHRETVPLRGDAKLGTTEKQDAFQQLMRTWLTTIQSPFHTKKPGSTHESDAYDHPLPADTHPEIVPAHLTGPKKGLYTHEWHEPVQPSVQNKEQLEEANARQEEQMAQRQESRAAQRPQPGKSFLERRQTTRRLSPAQEQDAELADMFQE